MNNDNQRRSLLLEILAVVAVVTTCGAFGFYFFEKPNTPDLTIWDSFWWALVTITTIGYGDIFPKTAGGRLLAIFLMFAGIGTLGISTAAIAAYFVKNDQLQLLRLRRLSGHVVICGLGEKGLLLARSFHARGQAVVVIEKNENNEFLNVCREQGAFVLVGDAREPETLKMARVAEARTLIAVCGDDGANAEIAAHAREVANENPNHVLTCSTHIVDPELWYLLRKWEIAMAGTFRLQFFNVYDISARALLETYPPFSTHLKVATNQSTTQKPHLLIVGGGRLGQSLVVHAARSWRDWHRSSAPNSVVPSERLRVTLIDRNTETIKDFLHLRHPELEEVCQIDTHALDVDSPNFHRGAFLFNKDGACDVTQIYVCVDNDALALSAALALHHRIGSANVPIVVRMTQDAGLATLLRGINDQNEEGMRFGSLHAIGLLEQSCQPDLVLGGTNEILARALHEKYLSEHQSDEQAAQNPALAPWDKLPEAIKELNRSQANHISEKLKAIDCDIVPLADWNAAEFPFAPQETERMARMEHERWCAERRAQGWSYGPRDEAKKTNPSLLTWDELPEATREWNRQAVREIPASLERAGFQIYRLQQKEM